MQEIDTQTGGIRSNRILSMFLDHALMTIVMMIVLIPWFLGFTNHLEKVDPSQPLFYLPDYAFILWAIGGGLYLSKDLRRGQSFAKQMFGFRVVDARTNKPAGPFRLVIRNLTAIIFPIEIVMLMGFPSRRIGDYLASTKVVLSPNTEEFPSTPAWKSIASVVFASILTFGITLISANTLQEALRPDYIRSSYNPELSRQLSENINPELGAGVSEAIFDAFDSTYAGNQGYVQGVVGVISESFLDTAGGLHDTEHAVLKVIGEVTEDKPYKVMINYRRAADHKDPGITRRYEIP